MTTTNSADAMTAAVGARSKIQKILNRPKVRRAALVVGSVLVGTALVVFGLIKQAIALYGRLQGHLVPVLVLLGGGLVLLAIGTLGGTLALSVKQLAAPLVVAVYLLLAWLILSNQAFFSSQDGSQPAPLQGDALGTRLQAFTFGIVSVFFLAVVVVVLSSTATSSAKDAVAEALSARTSTAPTVILLWSAVVVYAIAFVASTALTTNVALECGPDNPATPAIETATTNCIQASAWPDYLLLLGLPGVAAAIAKSRKVDPDAKPADKPGASASDRITEVQFLVFNAIAMVFVVWSLATRGVLGNIPDVLLGLTGASALTFSLAKRLPPAPDPGTG